MREGGGGGAGFANQFGQNKKKEERVVGLILLFVSFLLKDPNPPPKMADPMERILAIAVVQADENVALGMRSPPRSV